MDEYRKYQENTLTPVEQAYLESIKDVVKEKLTRVVCRKFVEEFLQRRLGYAEKTNFND